MRRIWSGLSVVIVTTFVQPGVLPAQEDEFFPTQPKEAKFSEATGILLDYGVGNKSGSFVIKAEQGPLRFSIGWPMYINDRQVTCTIPPVDGFKADPRFCSDWPADIRLGSTDVRVRYWEATYNKEQVKVSNQIYSVQ